MLVGHVQNTPVEMVGDVYLTHENCCISFSSDNCGFFVFFLLLSVALKQFEQKIEITE